MLKILSGRFTHAACSTWNIANGAHAASHKQALYGPPFYRCSVFDFRPKGAGLSEAILLLRDMNETFYLGEYCSARNHSEVSDDVQHKNYPQKQIICRVLLQHAAMPKWINAVLPVYAEKSTIILPTTHTQICGNTTTTSFEAFFQNLLMTYAARETDYIVCTEIYCT